ncbi:hypothetical protein ACFOVU_15425 [Nocardiopsis sediminis]|uniref:Uncharacterized protein n=1 Tax=Nocardiopsis sediminis TaxID=1778267 RepID=A0ABV8FRL2_9ACTN
MAHRHPTALDAEHVTHPAARRLLKAELANCAPCRARAGSEALADLEPSGVFDALLRGYALKRAQQWRTRRTRYPVTLADLAPPHELRFLGRATHEVARGCVIESRAGHKVATTDALAELRLLTDEERAAVLGDVIDGILEGEG